jgi:hypothetical protein
MTATILGNDIGIPVGSVTSDTYVFKSTCGGSGACAKVGLTRESGGRDVKSTLHKTAPRVYKGNEGPEPYVCVNPIGAPGQFTGEHKITVTKKRQSDEGDRQDGDPHHRLHRDDRGSLAAGQTDPIGTGRTDRPGVRSPPPRLADRVEDQPGQDLGEEVG